LYEAGLRSYYNNLWNYLLCNVYSLWNPDELHIFYIGLVKTILSDWLLPFLSVYQLRKRFNYRFISVPKYPNLHQFKRFFDEVNSSSWQGKELRSMVHFLLIITAPILEQEWKKLQAQPIPLLKTDLKYKKLYIESKHYRVLFNAFE
jgi:hypothetical protein